MKYASLAIVAFLLVMALAFQAQAQQREPVMQSGGEAVTGALDYDDCVRLALHQSPYFVTTGMQIELQRIDESDAFYEFFPDLRISSSYVVEDPDDDDGQRFSVGFTTGNYDPFSAYFEVQAAEIMTQMAVLGHLKAISDGIYAIGQSFLELNMLNRSAAFQDELVALAQHKGEYIANRIESGAATPLEARISEQEIELAKLEREQIDISRSALLDKIKTLLGVPVMHELDLDLQDADIQVLGAFDPFAVDMEDVHANSIDLKMVEYKLALQEYNIQLAYAEFIPNLSFNMTTADAVNSDSTGWYAVIGASTPLWDWGERTRNVTRQENRMANFLAEGDLTTLELDSEWRAALSDLQSAVTSVKLARARAELAGLRRRQGEISYHSGTVAFVDYLVQIENYFEAQKVVLQNELDYSKKLYYLRYVSGFLYKNYVDAELFYNE